MSGVVQWKFGVLCGIMEKNPSGLGYCLGIV